MARVLHKEPLCPCRAAGLSSSRTGITIGISCRRISNMKMPIKPNAIRIAAASLAFFLPALLLGDGAPLTGDAYINPGQSASYGALPVIDIGGAAGSEGLLQFDLSKLAPGT